MKKILTMLLLCLLLCACSAMALATTITYYDANFDEEKKVEFSGSVYTLPTYEEIGFTPSAGEKFYGWNIMGKEAYYKPGSKVSIGDEREIAIIAHYVKTNEQIFEVKIISREYNKNDVIGYYPCTDGELVTLPYPYHYGFGTDTENVEYFAYWKVEGEFEKFVPEYDYDSIGRLLFARAYAAELEANMNPEEAFYVHGPVTATAVWKNGGNDDGSNGGNDDSSNGGNDDGSNGGNDDGSNGGNDDGSNGGNDDGSNGGNDDGSNGGNDGGSNGGNNDGSNGGNDNGATDNLPKTGDDSVPVMFLLLALAVSIGSFTVLAKKRIN